jgi:septum site-determining protein MinD
VITSGKGGAGKTTVTAGLSSCLAAMGQRIICVDADIGARNLDIALGMADAVSPLDLADALLGRAEPLACLSAHPSIPNLLLLPAPLTESADNLPTERLKPLVEYFASGVDFVLVDCPAGLDKGFENCVGSCAEALLVTTAEPAARRIAAVAGQRLGEGKLRVNRVKPGHIARDCAPNIDELIDAAGLPLIGLIPEDEMVSAAAHRGHALVFCSKDGAAMAMLRIARRLLGEYIPLGKLKQWRVKG